MHDAQTPPSASRLCSVADPVVSLHLQTQFSLESTNWMVEMDPYQSVVAIKQNVFAQPQSRPTDHQKLPGLNGDARNRVTQKHEEDLYSPAIILMVQAIRMIAR